MDFNDTTTEQGLYQDALYLTGTTTATFSIEDFTRSANQAQNKVVALIQENDRKWKWSDSNSGKRDISVTDVVHGLDNYTMEVYHMKIKEVRIKDPQGGWRTLLAKDRRLLNDTEKNSTGVPESYDKDGDSIILTPTANYSMADGLEIHYQQGPVYFDKDDTDKQPGFCPLFHRLVSLYPAYDWLVSNATAINPLEHKIRRVVDLIKDMENDLVEHYQNRDEDEVVVLQPRRRPINSFGVRI